MRTTAATYQLHARTHARTSLSGAARNVTL